MKDSWNPAQYELFVKEREKPFLDLLAMVNAKPEMCILDLGCGTGRLTRLLHEILKAKTTLGIDSSESMLHEAKKQETTGLTFRHKEIEVFDTDDKFDLVFSNAALHWVPYHWELLPKFKGFLAEGGQMAIQIPANFNSPAYKMAQETAAFSEDYPEVLSIEEYSKILFKLGFKEQNVRMQIYPMQFANVEGFIEWLKGAYLTFYQSHLSATEYPLFLDEYHNRMVRAFGQEVPFFFPFKRILLWCM